MAQTASDQLRETARLYGPLGDAAREALAKAPQLSFREQMYWDAYGDLTTERPPAMAGMPAIPFHAIVAYGRYYGLTTYEIDRLVRVIMTLDRHHRAKAQADQKKG